MEGVKIKTLTSILPGKSQSKDTAMVTPASAPLAANFQISALLHYFTNPYFTTRLKPRYFHPAYLLRGLLVSIVCLCGDAAASVCEEPVGRFSSIEGEVSVRSSTQTDWLKAQMDTQLCEGDSIRAGKLSRAAVSLITDAVLRLDEETTITLVDVVTDPEERSFIDLVAGAFQSLSRHPRRLTVNTPYLNGSIEGTEFIIRVNEASTDITVFEGTVIAANDHGKIPLTGGQSAGAKDGQAPQRRVVVNPRNEVQWSIYYPPVMAAGDASSKSPVQEAAQLLSVGRFDQALTRLDQVIGGGAGAADAYALRAIVNIAQNQTEAARQDADKAVALNPDSAPAKIALSYVLQSQFEIQQARDSVLEAVTSNPEHALAWARLAELELMLDNKVAALEAADRATTIDPSLARTHVVKGFMALSDFNGTSARASFQQAISLDSSDPMSHLGLGLGLISDGKLAKGRQELEAAVALDSNNALLRSYLGKAYFEEKRSPLDAQQFDIAKQLDPKDPTAYLYAGIAAQTANRPVEAVRNLEASVALNKNRGVYRSRLLLDKDRGARGTSLARAYSDLGFNRVANNQATESLIYDPSNAAAHRFLSDSLKSKRRHEAARVSELLQAQMLQDVNINPVQPSVSEANLNITSIGGPASAGFNEFTPLFHQNQTQLNVSAMGVEGEGWDSEAVLSGVHDRFSYSAGAYRRDTDGFRDNYGIDEEIYNIFAQYAINEKWNIQAEIRRRESESGNLALMGNPDVVFTEFGRFFEDDSYRIGLRYSPTPNSTFLFSQIHSERKYGLNTDEILFEDPGFVLVQLGFDQLASEKADQSELQYIYKSDRFNLIAGGAFTDIDKEDTASFHFRVEEFVPPFFFEDIETFPGNDDSDDLRGYVYTNINVLQNMVWTLGFTHQSFDGEGFKSKDQALPKAGLEWDLSESLTLRAAYFKQIKPAIAANRTLEPTQVAGFNQLYDDVNGTETKVKGLALDWKYSEAFFLGAEATKRQLEFPVFGGAEAVIEDRDEWLYNAYAYWALTDNFSVRLEGNYDKFEKREPFQTGFDIPKQLRTLSFPLTASYFNSCGFFAGLTVTHVEQDLTFNFGGPEDSKTNDSFLITDLSVGYRLPKRMGIISIAAHNLFGEDFRFMDDTFRLVEDQPTVSPYLPERSVFARVTLNF